MRSKAPALLPIFRSEMQAEILDLVLSDDTREWSVGDLARESKVPLTSVQSEVGRLVEADLLLSRKVGRTRLVRANAAHPLIAPLRQIVRSTIGAQAVVAEAFAPLRAERVIIFGSWAARACGEPGPFPANINVLVIATRMTRSQLLEAAKRAERRVSVPVLPVARTVKAWAQPRKDPLLRDIRARAYLEVWAPPRHPASGDVANNRTGA
jgi:hypothetical protein